MISLDAKVKRLFFDRPAVLRMMDRQTRRALSQAGAFIRTRARSLIRKRKAVSAPGSAPSSHTSDRTVTLRNIQFAATPDGRGVVVGPVRLNAKAYLNGQLRSGTVPEVLEKGGTEGIREERLSGGRWVPVGRRSSNRPKRVRQAHYAPRPFMAPALRAEAPNLPRRWGATLRGG